MINKSQTTRDDPLISVIVVSYNHQLLITQCLDSIIAQEGDFKIELVIGDDFSTDGTGEIIREYINKLTDQEQIAVRILPTDHNYGMTQNYKRCFEACAGDYFAICEGDDYWIDKYKLQKQMDFLKNHPQCSMCFNDLYVLFEDKGTLVPAAVQQQLKAEIIKSRDLVLRNYIWNFSCCMYDAKYLHSLPEGLYQMYFADWMFNICYSQHGDIGHIKEFMSVYRKHKSGVWSTKSPAEADNELYPLIDQYNKLLNFEYDIEFSKYQRNLEENSLIIQNTDIAIIDNIFRDPPATFWMQELKCYLEAFENARFYSLNEFYPEANGASLYGNISEFKRKFPNHAHQIKNYYPNLIRSAKIVHSNSLRSAYESINIAEKLSVPFVFSLYREDGPSLFSHTSNSMLKRIISSPVFRKVIVTQEATHDYLVENQLCQPEQIEYILEMDNLLKPIDGQEITEELYVKQILPRINLLKREIEQTESNEEAPVRTMNNPSIETPRQLDLKQHVHNSVISLIWNMKRVLPSSLKDLIKKTLKAITPYWLRNAIRENLNKFRAL